MLASDTLFFALFHRPSLGMIKSGSVLCRISRFLCCDTLCCNVVWWGSTPSKPVHCIVWAKQLFQLMFGKTEESMLYEDPVTGKSAFMDQVCICPPVSDGNGRVTIMFSTGRHTRCSVVQQSMMRTTVYGETFTTEAGAPSRTNDSIGWVPFRRASAFALPSIAYK